MEEELFPHGAHHERVRTLGVGFVPELLLLSVVDRVPDRLLLPIAATAVLLRQRGKSLRQLGVAVDVLDVQSAGHRLGESRGVESEGNGRQAVHLQVHQVRVRGRELEGHHGRVVVEGVRVVRPAVLLLPEREERVLRRGEQHAVVESLRQGEDRLLAAELLLRLLSLVVVLVVVFVVVFATDGRVVVAVDDVVQGDRELVLAQGVQRV